MNAEQLAYIEAAYAKLKGIDIFRFKAYFEKTNGLPGSDVWVALSEFFVNLPFMLLNLVVMLFSVFIKLFETLDIYNTYKVLAYNVSKELWLRLNGSGNYTNSVVYLLIAGTGLYIFIAFLFSRGDFTKRLLHLLAVMVLGLVYFGTVNGTSGGIYLLDGIHHVSETAKSTLMGTAVKLDNETTVTTEASLSEQYVARTSYATYLYVNTGNQTGTYQDSQTGEQKPFDDSKVLGQTTADGTFENVKISERLKYLDTGMGHGGADGTESNRWVSAVGDLIFLKFLFVIAKLIEAIALGLPLLMIEFFEFVSQLVVLVFIILFPVGLALSFIPRLQDVVANLLKTMFGALAFPSISGVLILVVFYLQNVVAAVVSQGVSKIGHQFSWEISTEVMLTAFISAIVTAMVFLMIWLKRTWFLKTILGSGIAQNLTDLGGGVYSTFQHSRDAAMQSLHFAQSGAHLVASAGSGLAFGAGMGVGALLNAKDNFSYLRNHFASGRSSDDRRTFSDSLEGELYDPKASNSPDWSPNHALGYDGTIDGEFSATEDRGYLPPPDIEQQEYNQGEFGHSRFDQSSSNDEDDEASFDEKPHQKKANYRGRVNSSNQTSRPETSPPTSSDLEDADFKEKPSEPSPELTEYEQLRRAFRSRKQKKKIERLEGALSQYDDPKSFYQATGYSGFGRGFRKSMNRDERIKSNIRRRNKIQEELERLREGI